ncbi:hypothetical protein GRF59_18735 [Paenibacillus sp. HJL G12]|uniref:Uncharacterized protein n=1 Tax=Paenibacillus dendrobii TaxID=2691084 RepID=A0A7X3LJK9_9BACL|nr:hypothetical protein [Paenibacillus dendrobii]MWV45653.1 hypothetical protein [Paenibacillus dendrobii]
MANWFIKQEDKLFVYEKKGLHRLHMPPETEQILRKSVFDGNDSRLVPIEQSLADRLLKRSTGSGSGAQLPGKAAAIRIAESLQPPVPGAWQMLHLDAARSVLFRNVTAMNFAELLAAAENGGRVENDDLLLDIYAGHMAVAGSFHAEDAGKPDAKCVLLLSKTGKQMAVQQEMLSDYPIESCDLMDVLAKSRVSGWTDMIDAMEKLEGRIVPNFLYRSNAWSQVPYKLAQAEDGSFFAGESGAEQIVYASCRNLELLLKRMDPDSEWLVTAGREHGLKRLAQFLLEHEVEGPDQLLRDIISYKNTTHDRRIHAMIDRFVPEADTLQIYVEHALGSPIWAASAGYQGRAWTDKVYGISSDQVVHEALIRFYALVRQNGIRNEEPGTFQVHGEEDSSMEKGEFTGDPAAALAKYVSAKYETGLVLVSHLHQIGISMMRLRSKGRGEA